MRMLQGSTFTNQSFDSFYESLAYQIPKVIMLIRGEERRSMVIYEGASQCKRIIIHATSSILGPSLEPGAIRILKQPGILNINRNP